MKHGTRAAYANGCKCLSCRSANAAYQSEYRRLKRAGKTPLGAKVSAIEAWRRIRQLKAERYHIHQITQLAGWKDRHLPVSLRAYDKPEHVDFEERAEARITLRTHLRMLRAYRLGIVGAEATERLTL